METIVGIIVKLAGSEALYIAGVPVLLYIFKKIPNDKIQAVIGRAGRWLGIGMTAGLSRYSVTKMFWNKHIEPWFIDIIENTAKTFIDEFVVGLRSDNPNNG